MPGVPQPTVLDELRRGCQEVLSQPDAPVSINHDAVEQLAGSLSAETVKASLRGNVFPVKFDDIESEITFLTLYHMLDFGSGYDDILLRSNRRDAHETIQFGAIGIHLTAPRIDHHWMKAFSNYGVHNAFGVEAMEEQEVMPGVIMSKPGPLQPLVTSIREVINSAGAALEARGERTLGEHVLNFVDHLAQSGKSALASSFITDLSDNFPGFQDTVTCHDQQLPLLRKAQKLAFDLYLRFGTGEHDDRFKWADVDKLTADSGSLLPAVLRYKAVLQYSEALAAAVDARQPLPPGNEECTIRAAAVVAVDAMVQSCNGAINAAELSSYLLSLTDEDQELHGKVVPHLTRETTAY
eukprot:jgi/Chrzof1/13673/Cz08g07170.t1